MRLFLLFLLVTSSAHAQWLNKLCQENSRNLQYTSTHVSDGERIWTSNGQLVVERSETFLAFEVYQNQFWKLQKDRIIVTSAHGQDEASFDLPDLSSLSWGKQLVTDGSLLYIIREAGVSAFDLSSRSFLWNESLNDLSTGQAVDGAHDGQNLYVLMVNSIIDGFDGVVVMNSKGERLNALPLNKTRSGVLVASALSHWKENKLFINNAGWMLSLDKKQLMGSKALVTKLVPTALRIDQNTKRQVSLNGDFFFSEREFSGCASYGQMVNGEVQVRSDLFRFPLPR